MTQQTRSTVRIHAAYGRTEELHLYLHSIVERLPQIPGCLASTLKRDEHDSDLWIIDVNWESCAAMSAHFAQPNNEGLNGLLSKQFVRQVAFDSDIERCNLPEL